MISLQLFLVQLSIYIDAVALDDAMVEVRSRQPVSQVNLIKFYNINMHIATILQLLSLLLPSFSVS